MVTGFHEGVLAVRGVSSYNPHRFKPGQVAQLVEQRTENPRVGSSILPLATLEFL